MKFKNIPDTLKPRERLINYGAEHISDDELLSIILKTGTKDKNVKELALDILSQYKEITKLKETDFIEYVRQKEILFIKDDIKKLRNEKTDYSKILKYYKRKLVDYGVMKQLKNSYTSQGNYIKIKEVK